MKSLKIFGILQAEPIGLVLRSLESQRTCRNSVPTTPKAIIVLYPSRQHFGPKLCLSLFGLRQQPFSCKVLYTQKPAKLLRINFIAHLRLLVPLYEHQPMILGLSEKPGAIVQHLEISGK